MILCVRRVDSDERYRAPILTAFERRRSRGVGVRKQSAAEVLRNAVGMDRDQADRFFTFERTKALDDRPGRQSEAALARDLDGDEIAIDGAGGPVARNRQFAAELLLVDRNEPPGAVGQSAKNAEHAMLGAIKQLDDAAVGLFAGALDAQQCAVADAGHVSGPGSALRSHVNDRRRAVGRLVPFGRPRDKFAVAVPAGDVANDHGRQGAGAVQLLSEALDMTAVGQFAQHALKLGAIGILGAERAGHFAGADIAGVLADESQKLIARGEGF